MNISDETLMAFADGELDLVQHARMEAALKTDAALRQRVVALQAQRKRLAAAFDTVLDEPVPDRLTRLLQTPPAAMSATPVASVVNLAQVRADRARTRGMPSWAQWGGMAASILLGVWLGAQLGGRGMDSDMALNQGRLLAGGTVAKALATQLASEPPQGASVAVQLSFVDKGGNYCRTFSTSAIAGLACLHKGQWAVQQATAVDAQASGEVRQAASALPRAVLDAVDQRIAGSALDAKAERTARDQAWRR
ncbi:MAG: hypothetical protein V4858_07900 [Pseudomonadota bacterium]